jgi:hypothetical protein
MTTLLLRQQLADFKAGLPVGNLVSEARLSSRERDMLRDGLRDGGGYCSRVRTEIGRDLF